MQISAAQLPSLEAGYLFELYFIDVDLYSAVPNGVVFDRTLVHTDFHPCYDSLSCWHGVQLNPSERRVTKAGQKDQHNFHNFAVLKLF